MIEIENCISLRTNPKNALKMFLINDEARPLIKAKAKYIINSQIYLTPYWHHALVRLSGTLHTNVGHRHSKFGYRTFKKFI